MNSNMKTMRYGLRHSHGLNRGVLCPSLSRPARQSIRVTPVLAVSTKVLMSRLVLIVIISVCLNVANSDTTPNHSVSNAITEISTNGGPQTATSPLSAAVLKTLDDMLQAASGVYTSRARQLDTVASMPSGHRYSDDILATLNRTVVVTGLNYAYLPFFRNMRCYFEKLGIKLLVFALDEKVHKYLTSAYSHLSQSRGALVGSNSRENNVNATTANGTSSTARHTSSPPNPPSLVYSSLWTSVSDLANSNNKQQSSNRNRRILASAGSTGNIKSSSEGKYGRSSQQLPQPSQPSGKSVNRHEIGLASPLTTTTQHTRSQQQRAGSASHPNPYAGNLQHETARSIPNQKGVDATAISNNKASRSTRDLNAAFSTHTTFIDSPAKFQSRQFNVISSAKMQMVKIVLSRGYNAIFVDPDIAVVRDPIPHLLWHNVDYAHSLNQICNRNESHNAWDFHTSKLEGNTGFYFVRSNDRTLALYQLFDEEAPKYPHLDDQTVFWQMLRSPSFQEKIKLHPLSRCTDVSNERKKSFLNASDVKTNNSTADEHHDTSLENTTESTYLVTCPLDMCQFTAGAVHKPEAFSDLRETLLRRRNPISDHNDSESINHDMRSRSHLFTVHANWMISAEAKAAAFKQHNLWLDVRFEDGRHKCKELNIDL